jgi:c-di-GMP-binding flagellar brake protein YcgR
MLAEPLPHTSDIEKFAEDHERFARHTPSEISIVLRNLVQRREYFRVPTPILDPFYAKGAFADGDSFRYEVHDLSLGGIALRMDTPRLAVTELGTVFNDVVLHLGPGAALPVDLELVSPRTVTTPRGDVRYVVGFRFVQLSGAAENVLQRLITRMEAKRRSLSE